MDKKPLGKLYFVILLNIDDHHIPTNQVNLGGKKARVWKDSDMIC